MHVTDAYDYTDKLKKELARQGRVEEVSTEFRKLTNNASRVEFVE
jgi:ribonuclease D